MPEGELYGGFNHEGCEKAEFIFVTVPGDGHHDVLTGLAEMIGDKIVVDCVAPMVFDKDGPKPTPPEAGSAAEEAQQILANAKVVSAFHHLDAKQLQAIATPMQGDVIVCGDHKPAKKKVMALVEEIEYVRALDGGPPGNSRITEAITALLIHINRNYKSHCRHSHHGRVAEPRTLEHETLRDARRNAHHPVAQGFPKSARATTSRG